MTRVVAIVPAKGSSERIANKNLAVLDGEHLFKRKLRQLLDCQTVTEVCLDTEDETIASLASELNVRRLKRPKALATNSTDGHALFAWECSQAEADIYVQAICTAPFVTSETVDRAVRALVANPEKDSCVAVCETKEYVWRDGAPTYGDGRIPNSVDLPTKVIEAMSLYAVRRTNGQAPTRRFGKSPLLLPLNPQEAIDVNWPEDMALAETIAAGERARENLALQALVPYLGSGLLSDITRDMGLKCALPRDMRATAGQRLFGRAKTLLLDVIRDGEDWNGIYDALKTYHFVRPGDVVVVKNQVPDRAYFGNLNAQLAIRAGAVGAVIDGVTRDSAAVAALGFPVFARGAYAVDIKGDGLVREMNKPVTIGDVCIANGDYVFADGDGVISIPAQRWAGIRQRLLDEIEREWRVGRLAALGDDPQSIRQKLGDF